MYTTHEIMLDFKRGCLAYNIIEDRFIYRISYYVNRDRVGRRYYCTVSYDEMQQAIVGIIKKHLTWETDVVISGITAKKGTETMKLLSRSYPFSLETYFAYIEGRATHEKINRNRKTVCYR